MKTIIALPVLLLCSSAQADMVPVAEDEMVWDGTTEDPNLFQSSLGLLVGNTGPKPLNFYLKFKLPDFAVKSATLWGYADGQSSGWYQIRVTDDDWSEDTLTWSNRPSVLGPAIGMYRPGYFGSPGNELPGWLSWDITEAVNSETDGWLSLEFSEFVYTPYDQLHFVEHEGNLSKAFHMVNDVPEPSTLVLLFIGMGLIGLVAVARRR